MCTKFGPLPQRKNIDYGCVGLKLIRLLRFKTRNVSGQQRKLRNQEFHDLYSSSNVILGGRDEQGHVARMEEMKNAFRTSVVKPQWKLRVGKKCTMGG
jgi:hypothetical protein